MTEPARVTKQWNKKIINQGIPGILTWGKSLETYREKRPHRVCFVECNKSVHQGLWNGGQLESAVQQSERAAPSKTIIWCIIHSVSMVSRLLPLSCSVSLSFYLSLGSYGLPWRLWWSPTLSITHSSAAAWGLHNSTMRSPAMSFKSRTKSSANRCSCRFGALLAKHVPLISCNFPWKVTF